MVLADIVQTQTHTCINAKISHSTELNVKHRLLLICMLFIEIITAADFIFLFFYLGSEV